MCQHFIQPDKEQALQKPKILFVKKALKPEKYRKQTHQKLYQITLVPRKRRVTNDNRTVKYYNLLIPV
jgi:hypothetical protein